GSTADEDEVMVLGAGDLLVPFLGCFGASCWVEMSLMVVRGGSGGVEGREAATVLRGVVLGALFLYAGLVKALRYWRNPNHYSRGSSVRMPWAPPLVGLLGGPAVAWAFRAWARPDLAAGAAFAATVGMGCAVLAIGWVVSRFSYHDFIEPNFDEVVHVQAAPAPASPENPPPTPLPGEDGQELAFYADLRARSLLGFLVLGAVGTFGVIRLALGSGEQTQHLRLLRGISQDPAYAVLVLLVLAASVHGVRLALRTPLIRLGPGSFDVPSLRGTWAREGGIVVPYDDVLRLREGKRLEIETRTNGRVEVRTDLLAGPHRRQLRDALRARLGSAGR
ncbi:MAG TPA: hypothetical protein VMB50_08135, partial [Myxococcales bacterium]|nr:hypothetical protein [Myxococcales bacterium]